MQQAMKKKKTSPGKRARRRQRATIRRLRREVARLRKQEHQHAVHANVANTECQTAQFPPPAAAMIYPSEMAVVKYHVLCLPDLETGGSLFGWYSETGLPIIALATGPGKNAKHGATSFHADEEYSFALGSAIAEYGLQHIGEWHSHHRMSLSHPSEIDCNAMQKALGTPSSLTPRFLCGIANILGDEVTLNLYYFSVEQGERYKHVPLEVKGGISLVRAGLAAKMELGQTKGG